MATSAAKPTRLTIDFDKIVLYLLDPNHKVGGPKASFFLSLGFSALRPHEIASALFDHATGNPMSTVRIQDYGINYVFEGPMNTPNGKTSRRIRSVWEHKTGTDFLRLVTAHPL